MPKSHFWGIFWHFKPKWSSALQMEYPKKVSLFLAEISNLSCQYIRFQIGEEYKTSVLIAWVIPISLKNLKFWIFQEIMHLCYPKNWKKGHLLSKTWKSQYIFLGKKINGYKKLQILPSKLLFYFHFQFWSLRQLWHNKATFTMASMKVLPPVFCYLKWLKWWFFLPFLY